MLILGGGSEVRLIWETEKGLDQEVGKRLSRTKSLRNAGFVLILQYNIYYIDSDYKCNL